MNYSPQRLFAILLCMVLLLPHFAVPGWATEPAENTAAEQTATDISADATVTSFTGFRSVSFLFNKDDTRSTQYLVECTMTMEHEEGIGSLYLVFLTDYGSYTITDNATGTKYVIEDALLHDFVNVEAAFGTAPKSITVTFPVGTLSLSEVYIYTPGQVPDFVQQWKLPKEGETDIVLFSTHADDEHLFFAGILPYYAKERGYQVQVVYLTDHHNNFGSVRQREMLDSLWAVGVDTYPVMAPFENFASTTKDAAYLAFARFGHTKDELIGFVVDNIRRFKPKAVIGHDFAGERNHGMHQVYAEILSLAVDMSMDADAYPESAATYGVWDVPKTYFHLYEENPIVMDFDQPLESFGGMTAFEVSIQRGFQAYKSQIPSFAWYYAGASKASEVKQANPCYYGLFRSTVGEDVAKNDIFENLTTHAEDAIVEAQRKAEEEAARLAAEQEAKRKLEEETAAREAARVALEEAAAQEAIRNAESQKKMMTMLWCVSIGLVIVAIPLAKIGKKEP